MTKRDFARSGNGLQRSAYRITCEKCGCSDHVNPGNNSTSLPPEFVAKKFAQKGWKVAGVASKDMCPSCDLKRQPPRSLVLKFPGSDRSIPIGIVDMPQDARSTTVTSDPRRADPPVVMSRETRRLIFLKLEEVYVDEKTGYSSGWSDARVADDLGIPRAWIAEVREPNFGPDRNEEQRRNILIECREASKKCEEVVRDVKKKLSDIEVLSATILKKLHSLRRRERC